MLHLQIFNIQLLLSPTLTILEIEAHLANVLKIYYWSNQSFQDEGCFIELIRCIM